MNMKNVLEYSDIEWWMDFTVTENGFGNMDFTAIWDTDILHSDVVKITDDATTVREYTNNRHISFDWTNDYIQSGYTENIDRRDWRCRGNLVDWSDWNGDFVWPFDSAIWVDIGKQYEFIDTAKPFSVKLTVKSPTTWDWIIVHFWSFLIRVQSWEIRVWFSWWTGASFPNVVDTYYRIVATYDGAWNWVVYYNGVLAVWTNAPTWSQYNYCFISNRDSPRQWLFYWLCLWYVVLTAWEITTENGAHLPQKSDNRFAKREAYNIYKPSMYVLQLYDGLWKTIVRRDGVATATLTATTNIVMSAWVRLWTNWVNTFDSQAVMVTPYGYIYVRNSTNDIRVRYDNAWTRGSTHQLWAGYTTLRVHIVWVIQNNWWWSTRLYVNWALVDSDSHWVWPSMNYITNVEIGRKWSTYFNWRMTNASVHTFTWGFADSDAVALYNWRIPTQTAWISQYIWRELQESTWTIAEDTNDRKGTLINSPNRVLDNTTTPTRYEDKAQEKEIYFWQVIAISPAIQSKKGKRTNISCIGIQTTLNNIYFRSPLWSRTRNWLLYPNIVLQYIYDQYVLYYPYLSYKWEENYSSALTIWYGNPWWATSHYRERYNTYIIEENIAWPDWVLRDYDRMTPLTWTMSLGNYVLKSWHNASHIVSFWVKSQSSGNITISYSTIWWILLPAETYSVTTERKKVSINRGGSWGSWGIYIKIDSTISLYITDYEVYQENESTVDSFWTAIMQLDYNNTKLLTAFQDAIEYGGGKIRRDASGFPVCFEPDITWTPDHYISEEKHCSYIDKNTTSDEIANAVEVDWSAWTTTVATDATSITTYWRKESAYSATNINNVGTANNYRTLLLASNKDPKNYIKIVVTKAYDIASLRVWDLIELNWNSLGLAKWYITRLDMREDECTIYIGNYDGLWKILAIYR